MGWSPSEAPCACGSQDDEVRGVSSIRRMPFRAHGYVTQLTNMRATAKQRGCDRVESDK